MHKAQEQVLAFHSACGLPIGERPNLPIQGEDEVRLALILEEASEFAVAFAKCDMVEMIDALCDLLYVTYGAAVTFGIDLEPFYDEVHRSNMEKTRGPKRADGKQLKPEGWQPPDIVGILRREYNRPAGTVS